MTLNYMKHNMSLHYIRADNITHVVEKTNDTNITLHHITLHMS